MLSTRVVTPCDRELKVGIAKKAKLMFALTATVFAIANTIKSSRQTLCALPCSVIITLRRCEFPIESSFCAVLNAIASQASAGREVEVIKLWVSGYGPAQELITLREYVWQYSPDIILLTITTNNDISNNVREL